MKSKLTLITALLSLSLAGFAHAQSTLAVPLEWDASAGADGYRLYQKVITPAPGPIGGTVPPPAVTWKLIGETAKTTFTVTNAAPVETTYAVTAHNAFGESARSNELTVTPKAPQRPGNLRPITRTTTTP